MGHRSSDKTELASISTVGSLISVPSRGIDVEGIAVDGSRDELCSPASFVLSVDSSRDGDGGGDIGGGIGGNSGDLDGSGGGVMRSNGANSADGTDSSDGTVARAISKRKGPTTKPRTTPAIVHGFIRCRLGSEGAFPNALVRVKFGAVSKACGSSSATPIVVFFVAQEAGGVIPSSASGLFIFA